MKQRLEQWGLYLYAACALAWLIGYFNDWEALLWGSVLVALLLTSLTEYLDWRATGKKIHLVIPVLTVVWVMACLLILFNQL